MTLDCFVVMPFGKKLTSNQPLESSASNATPIIPKVVDFTYLWEQGLRPALAELGCRAIRADVESGSVILSDMLQRLRYADLVVADVSIPNGNVYYEIGVRHAARETGCVLIGASWSSRLFDLDQVRTLRYSHTGEQISQDEAKELKNTLQKSLIDYAGSRTPYHLLTHERDNELFKARFDELYALQQRIMEFALLPSEQTEVAARKLIDELAGNSAPPAEGVEQLVRALRDLKLWSLLETLIDQIPGRLRGLTFVQEQLMLARSEQGDYAGSAAALEAMIGQHGGTPERYGLLGGRYKRMWNVARKQVEAGNVGARGRTRQLLDRAINAYTSGMEMDLNSYYCSCNLPLLLLERDDEGDRERARTIDLIVVEACKRAERLGIGDEWLPATLFGAAFRSGNIATARSYLRRMQNASGFQRESTTRDAQLWLRVVPESAKADLQLLVEELL